MKPAARKFGATALGATILLLVAVLAFSIGQTQPTVSSDGGMAQAPPVTMEIAPAYDSAAIPAEVPGSSDVRATDLAEQGTTKGDIASPETTSDKLVIRTANMEMRVTDVDAALAGLRAATRAAGAEISDMSVVSGEVRVMGTEGGAALSSDPGPATAYVTLRVPADKLEALETSIAKLGTVLTQSSNANDVTEQAVDMEARLRNLRAEEARLRTFLNKTNKVSELLEVERELSRVRGEIEVMDAQLTYLKRQAALSTLSVTLSEPGPVVQPAGATWGIREAVTRGIQAAAALITTLITVAIPLALLALVVGVVAWPVRIALRRRAARRGAVQAAAPAPERLNSDDEQ